MIHMNILSSKFGGLNKPLLGLEWFKKYLPQILAKNKDKFNLPNTS
jgi:hypothetical protein